MIARLLLVAVWLLLGHTALFAVYWGLLNVPESNVAMLVASAALVLALVAATAVLEANAVLQLGSDAPWRARARRALAAIPTFIIALLVWLTFAWLCARLGRVHAARSGEIDAWLIAHFDWTGTAWLHRGIRIALDLLRDVIGLSLAVGALVAGTLGTFSDVLRLRWVPRAFAWRRLLIITLAVVGLVWLPWQGAAWRPTALPATIAQPIFAAVKLALIALVAHVGWTIILWIATRTWQPARRG